MELLRADQVRPEPGERVFRHGRIGPLVMLAIFSTPLVLGLVLAVLRRADLAALPWYAWIPLGPLALLGGGLLLLVVHALAQVAARSFRASNWLLAVSPAGLVLNLRSYQNAHFESDGPTVLRLAWSEVRCAREVRDVTPRRDGDATELTRRWLEIELAGVDTDPIEALVRAERERPAPETRSLGVRSRTRFGHVPAFVAAPGLVRTDWLGRRVLAALGAHVSLEERRSLAHQPGLEVERRLADLVRRGDRLAAIDLARRELGLSLTEARARVRDLDRAAA